MSRHAQATALGNRTRKAGKSQFPIEWIGRHLGGAERRRVAILSCGIAAAAGAVDRFDPEDMAPAFGRYRQEARRLVERFGGRIIGQSGTSMMACWGLPGSGEDHLRLALSAALRITAICPELRLAGAVETGLVVAGPITGEAEDLNLVGPVLRKAERLQSLAHPGWVLVSEAVRPLVEHAFEMEPLQSPAAAGCWRVRSVRPDWRRATEAACGFVGRAAERQALDELWLRVVSGRPQCVSICGEAGIGKSRLLRKLEQNVRSARGTWIEIDCFPETSRAPLHPVRRAMRGLLASPNTGLARHIAGLSEADRRLLNVFLRMGGDVNDVQPEVQASHQDRLFGLMMDSFTALACESPLAIVCEDLHWADPATLEFIARAAERLPTMGRVCLAWTTRGQAEPHGLRTSAQRTSLPLGRLTSDEIQQLLACSSPGATLTQEAREQIALRSEGIPLFAEELARVIAGAPDDQDGMDVLLEPGPLNVVLSARLDGLGELKSLAQAAAVIGREFDASVLALVLQMDASRLSESLEGLVARGFLKPVPEAGAGVFRFTHSLLRDAAYASVLKSRRRELHRTIADILANCPKPAADHGPEIVAEHYTAAGDGKGAFTWWYRAGLRAAEISAIRASAGHLKRALAVRARDPGAGSIEEEIEILRLLGIQLAALKGNGAPEVVETLQRCLDLSREAANPGGDFDALWALHSCYLVRGEINRALEIGKRLTASADRDGPEERRLRAHRMQGLALMLGGRMEEAFRHYGLVLAIYQEGRHAELRFRHASDQGAVSYAHLAWGQAIAGRLEESDRNAEAALALASRLQHPHTSAHVLCVMAARAQTIGHRQAASALAFAGRTLGERHEFPYWTAWADIILGWTQQDRDGRGIELIEAAIRAYRRTGAAQALPYALLLLAESALACNRPRRALSACEEGWQLAERNGLTLYASELLRVRAVAELRLGSPLSRVLNLAAQAEILASNQGAVTFRSRAAEFRSHLCEADLAK